MRNSLLQLLETGGPPLEKLDLSQIAIYGAGICGRKVAARARERGITVRVFVDERAASIQPYDGIPCLSPQDAAVGQLAEEAVPIVLGIFNHAVDVQPIHRLLANLGFSRVVPYPEFHEHCGDGSDFWVTKRTFYRKHAPAILAAFDLFEDTESQKVFHDCIVSRLTFAVDLLRQPDSENPYLPSDLPPPVSPMRLIDGGAFTGDTLQSFLDHRVKFEAVAAFEPDPANYRQLCLTVESSVEKLGKVALLPCGLGEETATQSFHVGAGTASGMTTAGSTSVQVVSLDDALPGFAPTFIKLDIEGAEDLALRGAAKMIKRFGPRLAVCVYHRPEHLWTLPKLMRNLRADYRLALRYHYWNGFDTVAYAFTS